MILGCGPIGLMAVAVCAASGAANIVAIDILDKKLELAEELGANITINTKNVDLPHEIFNITKGQGVDVIIDYSGNVGLIANAFKALKKGGRFTLVGLPDKPLMLDATSDIIYKEAVVNGVTGRLMYKTWFQCNELLTSGTVDFEKIVGGVYSLEEFDDAFSALKNGASGKMMFRFE
jgi:threonine 3-dehydrogenase